MPDVCKSLSSDGVMAQGLAVVDEDLEVGSAMWDVESAKGGATPPGHGPLPLGPCVQEAPPGAPGSRGSPRSQATLRYPEVYLDVWQS